MGYKQGSKTNNQIQNMEEVNKKNKLQIFNYKKKKYKISTKKKKNKFLYVHFLCTIPGPDSSYSSFEIHISWNVDNDDKILPPIHTEYFLSGGATIFTLILAGANVVISFVNLTSIPGNIVVPPDNTVFVYKSLRISTSHFMILSYANL